MVRVVSFLSSELTQLWKGWTTYNPERHYMRGPGPKWREKHASLRIANIRAEPAIRIDGPDAAVSTH